MTAHMIRFVFDLGVGHDVSWSHENISIICRDCTDRYIPGARLAWEAVQGILLMLKFDEHFSSSIKNQHMPIAAWARDLIDHLRTKHDDTEHFECIFQAQEAIACISSRLMLYKGPASIKTSEVLLLCSTLQDRRLKKSGAILGACCDYLQSCSCR